MTQRTTRALSACSTGNANLNLLGNTQMIQNLQRLTTARNAVATATTVGMETASAAVDLESFDLMLDAAKPIIEEIGDLFQKCRELFGNAQDYRDALNMKLSGETSGLIGPAYKHITELERKKALLRTEWVLLCAEIRKANHLMNPAP